MESGIIDQPPTEKNTNGNSIDRISELPDCILHHILSFLETKCTVQTSILSKRWRHIWASVPALDLTDYSFIRYSFWGSNDSYKRNFENFVDTVSLLRDESDLRSFSLRCYQYFDAGHVHRWIRYATKYNPKVLQIKLAQWYNSYCFPLEILPCQFLEELSMNLHFIVQHGPPKIMGCLRRLHIQSVNYKYGFMENLISSCPVLEDLDLYNCVFDALCISSNTLKRLCIDSCIFGSSENLISSCPVLEDLDLFHCAFDALCISSNTLKRLRIDSCGSSENLISAPSLICLTYTYNRASATLKNLSSLLNATVHIIRGDAFEMARGLANVETLTFSFSEVYQRKLPEDLFPIFDNLRSLRFAGKCTSYMIQVIAFFLQRSPNLETFTLKNMGVSPLSLWRWKVIQKSSKLSFKCPHLQLIQILCSRREVKLRELFKYLRELFKYLMLNATGEPKVVIIWDWRYF